TAGCSGACGFLRCEVTKNAEATVVTTVIAVTPTLRRAVRTSGGDRRLEEGNPVERRAEDLSGIGAEVSAQNLLFHGPKVDGVLEVARVVETREAGLVAVETAMHRVADQHQGCRGTMV